MLFGAISCVAALGPPIAICGVDVKDALGPPIAIGGCAAALGPPIAIGRAAAAASGVFFFIKINGSV